MMLIGSLELPTTVPQSIVCTANVHTEPLVGLKASVQVTVALVVLVGQWPQFEANML